MDEQAEVNGADARPYLGVIPQRWVPGWLKPRGPSNYGRNLVVLAGRELLTTTSRWVAVGCWTVAAGALLLMYTPNGIVSVGGRVVAGLAIALSVVVGALWWWRGWPRESTSIRFAVSAELVYTAVLLSCSDSAIALLASIWFFLIGDYLVFAHQHPALVLHGGWVVANLVYFGTMSIVAAPDVDNAYVVILVLAISGAVVVIPMFAQRFTDSLRNTSQRSVELAHRDPLTRLLNRRGLSAAAGRVFHQIHADGSMVGVMVIDIDQFKMVNDVYGHQQGDAVLELLSQRLQRSVRRHGVVARFGGEEFVVIDRVTSDGLLPLADRLREACHNADDTVPISVSVGAVGMFADEFPTLDPQELLDTLFDRADGAMYTAKQRGGNQAVLDPSMPAAVVPVPAVPAEPPVQLVLDQLDLAELHRSADRIFDQVVARRIGPEHQAS